MPRRSCRALPEDRHNVNHRSSCLGAAFLVLAASSVWAATESFVIDAQYRGIVSKSFPAIGSATVTAVETAPGVMRFVACGQATHPRDKRQFQTTVEMSVRVAGDRLDVLRSSQQSRPGSEQFAGQIQDVVPILEAVRRGLATDPVMTLDTPGGPVKLERHTTATGVEVTAQRGPEFVGKFFFTRQGAGMHLDRFRVPAPEDNVTLNFVVQS